MFRKLVSNLSFSPALVGQLGFYARRLRKEQVTRQLGLVVTILALIVQSFAIFKPPESALAASPSNIIYGGVQTVDDVLHVYDNKSYDFQDLMNYVGITRSELASMNHSVQYVCSSDHSIISFGRQHRFSTSEGEITHSVPSSTNPGQTSTFYSVPLYRFDVVNHQVNCYDSFVGNSKKIGWFSIMRKCGNLQIKKNISPHPVGGFVTATCNVIQGYAYDERQLNLKTSVILYLGGPPGNGERLGPVEANQSSPSSPVGGGHGFSVNVPEKYKSKTTSTQVWAVVVPLAGWNGTVQFANTATIPGNCVKPTPVASCGALQSHMIERDKFQLSASADVANGATVQGYEFIVTDTTGKVVFDKTYTSSQAQYTSETIQLPSEGKYNAKVIVKTSTGDKADSTNCATVLTVTPPNVCSLNPSIPNGPDCQPCPYDASVWAKDEQKCVPKITQSKVAKNLTQNVNDATTTTAVPNDRIEYTLYTGNESAAPITTNIDEDLTDVLEYATVLDAGGGTLQDVQTSPGAPARKTLRWQNITIPAGQTVTEKLIIQINNTIPDTPESSSDPGSYNCIITNAYGNTVNIGVQCPTPKALENTVHQLPQTGVGSNVIFAAITLMVVTYFYMRSRQMRKEVTLIRHEFNQGTL